MRRLGKLAILMGIMFSLSVEIVAQQDTTINYTFTGVGAGGKYVPLDSVRVIVHPHALTDLDSCEHVFCFPDTSVNIHMSSGGSGFSELKRENMLVSISYAKEKGRCNVDFYQEEDGMVNVRILSLDGMVLTAKSQMLSKGYCNFQVTLPNIGVSLLQIENESGTCFAKMIEKGLNSKGEIGDLDILNCSKQRILKSTSLNSTMDCSIPYDKLGYFEFVGYTTYQGKVYVSASQMLLHDNLRVFTFLFDHEVVEEGMLPGVFTNQFGEKFCFSKGNLQYRASTNEWRFAEHQYDFVGEEGNMSASATYDGWIDLFAWGTSGYDEKYPYINNICRECGYEFGNGGYDITNTNYDWGVYNTVSNGGNEPGLWHTMTSSEWVYIDRQRPNGTLLRGFGSIDGIGGLILLPDNWDLENDSIHTQLSEYTDNVYTLEQWNVMEKKGAVFFPAAGYVGGRDIGDEVNGDDYVGEGHSGRYVFSSHMSDICFYGFDFGPDHYWNNLLLAPGEWRVFIQFNRSLRSSVRPVQYLK